VLAGALLVSIGFVELESGDVATADVKTRGFFAGVAGQRFRSVQERPGHASMAMLRSDNKSFYISLVRGGVVAGIGE